MSYAWTDSDPADGFHARLDPVSAWLFRRDSPFLRTSDASGGAATLYAMPIDADGFQPDLRDAWRALNVPNPTSDHADMPQAAEAFTTEQIDALLGALHHEFSDPKVHVLPLVAGSALPADVLLRRVQLGTPRRLPAQYPLPETPRAIVGVIDHGINIFHHRFRHGPEGTRVAYAWSQGSPRAEGRLPLGREWIQRDIEDALAETGGDEDQLLRLIGADFSRPGLRPLGFRASHGTHVLDLAAGYEPDDPEGDGLPIIAVSLPPEVSRETSGSMLALPFALGLEFIADRARHIMHDTRSIVPVVVNVSFGMTGGTRAGMHRLERTVAQVAARHEAQVTEVLRDGDEPIDGDSSFTVVFAAGNNNLAQGHARNFDGANDLDIGWHLQPADPSANFAEIRLAPTENTTEPPFEITLRLTPPGSPAIDDVVLDALAGRHAENVQLLQRNGAVIGRLSLWRSEGGIVTLTLALDGTDPGPEPREVAPAGEWRLEVSYASPSPYRIDAWVLRDDVPGGFSDTGRQSYFVDANYRRYDETGRLVAEDANDTASAVRRAGSLNALATATVTGHSLCVGGMVDGPVTPQPAPYSAAPLDNTAEQVDVSAVSDRSSCRFGVLAAGTRSGTRLAINGTSVAAPQVVRHLVTGAGEMSPNEATESSGRLGIRLLRMESTTDPFEE